VPIFFSPCRAERSILATRLEAGENGEYVASMGEGER